MSLVWGAVEQLPNGWCMVTKPDRFSITLVHGSMRFVLGERIENGKYTNTRCIGGFGSVEDAQAEAERIAGARR